MSFPLSTLKELLTTKTSKFGVVTDSSDRTKVTVATSNGVLVLTKQGILKAGDKVSINDGIAFRLLPPSTVIEV